MGFLKYAVYFVFTSYPQRMLVEVNNSIREYKTRRIGRIYSLFLTIQTYIYQNFQYPFLTIKKKMKKLYIVAAAIIFMPFIMRGQVGCSPHVQVSNGFEDGVFMQAGGQLIANDFHISTNATNFALSSISANLLTQGGIASLDIIFYSDNEGIIGDSITAITGIVPTSQEVIGSAFDFDVANVIIDLATPIDFAGSTTYWMQIIATPINAGTQVAWEISTLEIMGNMLMYDGSQTEGWTLGNGDGVFSLSGACTLAEGCLFPANIVISNATGVTADVAWTELGEATAWEIQYGLIGFAPGSGTVVEDTDGIPGTTLTGLEYGQYYDVYITSICGDGVTSSLGGPATFLSDPYCAGGSGVIEAITRVDFAGISNITSAISSTPHAYFIEMQATVEQGGTYPIIVEGNSAGNWSNSYTLFVDWNQDGAFNANDERYEIGIITNSTGEDGMNAIADILVPEDAALGITRMRVVKMYTDNASYVENACSVFNYGQIEDYSVQVDIGTGVDFHQYNYTMGPNPTNDFLRLSSSENIQSVSLFTILGQKLIHLELNQLSPKIDMSQFENGTYLMKVEINNEKKVFKVVKQ